MLEFFRGAAKGWIAKIFLGLLVLSFAVWGIADVFRGGTSSGSLATVGNLGISANEYSEQLKRSLQQYSKQLGTNITLEKARELGLDRQVLADMMRRKAIVAQGDHLKLAVSDQMIIDEIAKNPAFQDATGKFDHAILKQLLDQNGMSEAGFVDGERKTLLASAIADTVDADYTPPNALLEAMFKHENEQRDIRYFVVKAAETEIALPTDEEIKAHHEANKGQYTAPEYRGIAIIKAEPADVAPRIAVNDDEIKTAYEKYKRDYYTPETRTLLQVTFPTLDEAKKAKARVDAGENFARIGEERGLKPADMLLGTVKKSDIIDSILADAAFALKEGEVSAPIEGKLAIALIKAATVTPEKQQTLDEAKSALADRIKLEKSLEEIKSLYDAVEDARAQQTPFEDIARRANLPFILVPAVSAGGEGKDGKTVELPHKDDVLKLAFASDAGVENDPFTTKDDGFIWYEVREVTPSAVRPLETVKDKVKADLIATRVRAFATGKARKIVERAKGGIAFEDLAREAAAEIKTIAGARRNETGADMDSEATAAVFAVPEKGFAFAPGGDGVSARIMQVQAVLAPKFDAKSKEAEALAKTLGDDGARDLAGLYVSGLQQQLGVTVNEDLWRQITGGQPN